MWSNMMNVNFCCSVFLSCHSVSVRQLLAGSRKLPTEAVEFQSSLISFACLAKDFPVNLLGACCLFRGQVPRLWWVPGCLFGCLYPQPLANSVPLPFSYQQRRCYLPCAPFQSSCRLPLPEIERFYHYMAWNPIFPMPLELLSCSSSRYQHETGQHNSAIYGCIITYYGLS